MKDSKATGGDATGLDPADAPIFVMISNAASLNATNDDYINNRAEDLMNSFDF